MKKLISLLTINKGGIDHATTKKWGVFLGLILLTTTGFAQEVQAKAESSFLMSDTAKFWILICMLIFQVILLYTISGIIRNLSKNKKLWSIFTNNKSAATVVTILFLTTSYPAMAQGGGVSDFMMSDSIENLLLTLNAILLTTIIVLLLVLKALIRALNAAQNPEAVPETSDFWAKFMAKMTDAVPIEDEEEVMTDHEYDGIIELDNNLPPWWVFGFYVSIVVSVFYIGYYHIYLDGNTMANEFNAEMAQAEKDKAAYLATLGNLIDETNVELLTSGLDGGKKIYMDNCAACHGGAGEGGIGPNLTDKYWLHGGGIKNVFSTIKYGVVEKGMISWKDQLTPPQMQQVSSYILTLQGTTPPNGKEPQGEIWEEEKTDEIEQPSDSTKTKVAEVTK